MVGLVSKKAELNLLTLLWFSSHMHICWPALSFNQSRHGLRNVANDVNVHFRTNQICSSILWPAEVLSNLRNSKTLQAIAILYSNTYILHMFMNLNINWHKYRVGDRASIYGNVLFWHTIFRDSNSSLTTWTRTKHCTKRNYPP